MVDNELFKFPETYRYPQLYMTLARTHQIYQLMQCTYRQITGISSVYSPAFLGGQQIKLRGSELPVFVRESIGDLHILLNRVQPCQNQFYVWCIFIESMSFRQGSWNFWDTLPSQRNRFGSVPTVLQRYSKVCCSELKRKEEEASA